MLSCIAVVLVLMLVPDVLPLVSGTEVNFQRPISSDWPPGPYATPMTIYGCPGYPEQGWRRGYINMTFKNPVTDERSGVISAHKLGLLGPYSERVVQLNFCYKLQSNMTPMEAPWPAGDYGVYRAGRSCPEGFEDEQIWFQFPPLLHSNTEGHVPDLDLEEDTNLTRVILHACYSTENYWDNVTVGWEQPFILLLRKRGMALLTCHPSGKHLLEYSPDSKCPALSRLRSVQENIRLIRTVLPSPGNSSETQGSNTSLRSTNFRYCLYSNYSNPGNRDNQVLANTSFRELAQKPTWWNIVVIPQDVEADYPKVDETFFLFFIMWAQFHPLTAYFEPRPSARPWVLIDLEQMINVDSVIIYYGKNVDVSRALSVARFYGDYQPGEGSVTNEISVDDRLASAVPRVLIGNDPGALLANGGFACGSPALKVNKWQFMIQPCGPLIKGRYVALVSNDNFGVEDVLPFVNKVFVTGVGLGCMKELGMTDGSITNYQITTSSSVYRAPDQPGWCAAPNDTAPYLMVDLLLETAIEGIRISTWAETVQHVIDGVHVEERVAMGVRALTLEYGPDESSLQYYKTPAGQIRSFQMDMSQPYESTQTFILLEPVHAKVVRLRSVGMSDPSLPQCMKVELLGCRHYKLKTLECSNRTTAQMRKSDVIYVSPMSYASPTIFVVNSSSDCLQACADDDDCTAAVKINRAQNTSAFGVTDVQCALYNMSSAKNYRVVTSPSGLSDLYQKICIGDPVTIGPIIRGTYDFKDPPNETVVMVTSPGVISSFGYPLYYDMGTITQWNVDLPGNGTIELIFTNISLNEYNNDYDPSTGRKCKDKIVIREPKFDHPKEGRPDVVFLDSTTNGKPFIFNTAESKLTLFFYACLRHDRISRQGSGWRAVVRKLETDVCKSTKTMAVCSSTSTEAILTSQSFLGADLSLDQKETWLIIIERQRLIFRITDINISCNRGSLLELTVDGRKTIYCNSNCPHGDIVPRDGTLQVLFRSPAYKKSNVDLQGFRASYKVERHNAYIGTMPVTTRYLYLEGETDERFEVCSETFAKCYHFVRTNPSLDRGPLDANKRCFNNSRREGNLVRIRNQAENDFLIYHLVYTMGVRLQEASMYIGLYSGVDVNGVMRKRWRDGGPITFTAWRKGHPDRQFGFCARIKLFTFLDENTWESVECSEPSQTPFYVCETYIQSRSYVKENLHNQLPESRSVEVESLMYRLFHCDSGEFVSRLYLCDGLRHCLDGSDEKGCKDFELSRCPPNYLRCGSGECVSVSNYCDFIVDCRDGSDEACDFPACGQSEFQCTNGQCIPPELVCDLTEHCWDGSDEQNCVICQGNTFRCNAYRCIPNSRLCDGFADCPNGRDETDCEPTDLPSCYDWWKRGYRKNKVYSVAQHDLECNFDLVSRYGIIQTLLGRATLAQTGDSPRVLFEDPAFVGELLWKSDNFRHTIVQTCNPPGDYISNVMVDFVCSCINFTAEFRPEAANATGLSELLHISPCSSYSQMNVDRHGEKWLLDNFVIFGAELGNSHTRTGMSDIFFKTGPLVFQSQMPQQTNISIRCRKGNIISGGKSCLFEVDVDGDLGGCRDFTHLLNCETFSCPEGFVKCPNSYCISISLLCDGQEQCPEGEDEVDCWCGSTDSHIVLLIPEKQGLNSAAEAIAKQVFQPGNNSNVVLYTYEILPHDSSLHSSVRLSKTIYSPLNIDHFRSSFNKMYVQDDMFHSENETRLRVNQLTPRVFQNENLAINRTGTKTSVVVLLKDDETGHHTFKEMAIFNHSMVNGVDIYVILIGKAKTDLKSLYTRGIPAGTRFVNFRNNGEVAIFAAKAFSNICAEQLKPTCPDKYRCHASRVCLELSSLCDGVSDCPLGDDERWCDFVCPPGCTCETYHVDCSSDRGTPDVIQNLHMNTRELDLNNNVLSSNVTTVAEMRYLVNLNLSHCQLTDVPRQLLKSMRNLLYLDLSFNRIAVLRKGDFINKGNLLKLDLLGNSEMVFIEPRSFSDLGSISSLTVTNTKLREIQPYTFESLKLTELTLSDNNIETVHSLAFSGLVVGAIDIRRNSISSFSDVMFKGVRAVKLLTDAYKFCCVKPKSVTEENCLPQRDEFSSCDDLMRTEALKFLLWLIGFLSLIGNMASLLYRLKFDRKCLKLGYGIFVTNLAVADFLMGLYLLTIAVADVWFRGKYIYWEDRWKNSAWCSMAGVISTMSSEASVLFICLITLDRILVIKYPFGDVRFSTKISIFLSFLTWVTVIIIALVPLGFEGQFYTRSAVCLALPLTRKRPPGWIYSTVVFVGFNLLAFLLIAVGQCLIYREIKMASSNKVRKTTNNRSSDLTVARNLLLVVSTDFLCWFPIGVMGLMALSGHVISGDVYAWAAVLILPVNSALNPFLYTLSAVFRKKDFQPSLSENTPTTCIRKDSVAEIVDLWNSGRLRGASSVHRSWRPLSSVLAKQHVPLGGILQLVYQINELVSDIHSQDMVTGDLSLDNVHVIMRNGHVRRTSLSTETNLSTRQSEKRKDIEKIGNLIYQILRQRKTTPNLYTAEKIHSTC